MRIIRQSSFTRVPWKNGGGATREALRMPAGDEPFLWRVSVADIGASGPFSDFAAYQRFMVLLKGAGMILKFARGTTMTNPDVPEPGIRRLRGIGDMAAFDGALATECELLGGPCVDLNLMVAKTVPGVQARVEVLRERRSFIPGHGGSILIFPIDAGVALESPGGAAQSLDPWDLALLSGPEDGAVGMPTRRRDRSVATIFWAFLPTTCGNAPTWAATGPVVS